MRIVPGHRVGPLFAILILSAIVSLFWEPASLRAMFGDIDYPPVTYLRLPSQQSLDSSDQSQPSGIPGSTTSLARRATWIDASTASLNAPIPDVDQEIIGDGVDSIALAIANAGGPHGTDVTARLATLHDELGFSSFLNGGVDAAPSSERGPFEPVFGGPRLNDRVPEIGFGFGAGIMALTITPDPANIASLPITPPGQQSSDPTGGFDDRVVDPPPDKQDDPDPVPEPASLILTCVGGGALAAHRLREKRARRA